MGHKKKGIRKVNERDFDTKQNERESECDGRNFDRRQNERER